MAPDAMTRAEEAEWLRRLTEEEAAGIGDLVAALEAAGQQMRAFARAVVAEMPELRLFFDPDDPQQVARGRELREVLRRGLEARGLSEYLDMAHELARQLAAQGVRFHTLVSLLTRFIPLLHSVLVEAYGHDKTRLVRALNGLHRLNAAAISAAGTEYAEVRESLLQQEYRRMLRELSVPVVPVWQGVLVVPLVGILDSARAREMTQTLLDAVVRERARVVILDITGVPTVDTQVADYLIRALKAARLLGTHGVLVGIRPAIAQTLVRLGVDLQDVHTEADLESGLQHAFRTLGYRIVREPQDG